MVGMTASLLAELRVDLMERMKVASTAALTAGHLAVLWVHRLAWMLALREAVQLAVSKEFRKAVQKA
jgi:hypothetical protein